MRNFLIAVLATAYLSACGAGGDGAADAAAPVTIPVTGGAQSGAGVAPLPAPVPSGPVAPSATTLDIGVYYYPGWHWDMFSGWKDPWLLIQPFPGLKPLLGWYDDTEVTVMRQQADWMMNHGINYVVFDWYYERGAVQADRPLKAFLGLENPRPKLSLLWANHTSDTTKADWMAIVERWIDYAKSPDFRTVDQRPQFFIFNAYKFSIDAKREGESATDWLTYAKTAFKAAGLPAPYIVANVFAGDEPIIGTAQEMGFAAVSSYNYAHAPRVSRPAYGYRELDESYALNWAATVKAGRLPMVVPISSGWDRTPWGGSTDLLRDNSMPTKDEFTSHLTKAKAFMKSNGMTQGVICCWNEFGEGSFIEPTQQTGMTRLEAIKAVFGGS